MHLLVLSAFRLDQADACSAQARSQCTFWCSVLSDLGTPGWPARGCRCLNAPFGAQCFPTRPISRRRRRTSVSMHLLVLSAFRQRMAAYANAEALRSQCTFWCSVLSDLKAWLKPTARDKVSMHLLVLSAFRLAYAEQDVIALRVSMHLLVLSAFRRLSGVVRGTAWSVSQCTFWCSVLSDWTSCASKSSRTSRLNAPFGAQCFPTVYLALGNAYDDAVSMHLLVLSAFRLDPIRGRHPRESVSMHLLVLSAFRPCLTNYSLGGSRSVSMHLLVLSAFRRKKLTVAELADGSQCTFWCSVLSDPQTKAEGEP